MSLPLCIWLTKNDEAGSTGRAARFRNALGGSLCASGCPSRWLSLAERVAGSLTKSTLHTGMIHEDSFIRCVQRRDVKEKREQEERSGRALQYYVRLNPSDYSRAPPLCSRKATVVQGRRL